MKLLASLHTNICVPLPFCSSGGTLHSLLHIHRHLLLHGTSSPPPPYLWCYNCLLLKCSRGAPLRDFFSQNFAMTYIMCNCVSIENNAPISLGKVHCMTNVYCFWKKFFWWNYYSQTNVIAKKIVSYECHFWSKSVIDCSLRGSLVRHKVPLLGTFYHITEKNVGDFQGH